MTFSSFPRLKYVSMQSFGGDELIKCLTVTTAGIFIFHPSLVYNQRRRQRMKETYSIYNTVVAPLLYACIDAQDGARGRRNECVSRRINALEESRSNSKNKGLA